MPESYFRRTGDTTFAPTTHCEGAWSAQDYHFSSLAGLIVHVAQLSRDPDDTKRLVRVSYDILGRLPLEEANVAVETIRPGRKIELVEVTVSLAGRAAIIARIWYIDALDTRDVETPTQQTYPVPEDCEDQGRRVHPPTHRAQGHRPAGGHVLLVVYFRDHHGRHRRTHPARGVLQPHRHRQRHRRPPQPHRVGVPQR
ncbi:hypothetical protein E3227_01945 [Corynebacterium sanguinis]|nr:hypothetical protein E3227_01945 [Corynebacterium sanguinis]